MPEPRRPGSLVEGLGAWLAVAPLPYDTYGLDPAALVTYTARSAEAACRAPDVMQCRAQRGPAEALTVFQPLAWDSEMLGVAAGRLSLVALNPGARALPDRGAGVLREAIRGALDAADGCGVKHLSVRVDARDTVVTQALEAEGFQIVDGILKFGIDLETGILPPHQGEVRDAREEDIPALRDLAARGFVYDRFHNDPEITRDTADALHAAWVENAVHGKTGCGVITAEVDGEPAGFFILGEDGLAQEVPGTGWEPWC